MNLDGNDKIKPTPFDAHESVVRQHHTHSAEEGHQPAEYEHQEFPKQVTRGKNGDAESAVVNSAEEEAAFLAPKKKAKAAAETTPAA